MKVLQTVLVAGLALFMLYEFFGDELINAAGFKSPIQQEVLADHEVSKDEALLLVVDFLERSGKKEAGAAFLLETTDEFICRATWMDSNTTSGDEAVNYSVDRVTGDVKRLFQK
ncbi:hypothetical protein CEF21_18495 [Bacillus sp. FJAT-42376]|uniref:hypothetical protein n=1 Tax=Bacillus sp. FJAT-42376 TaxID=2014076 RepID=UPI000F50856C|nr:hypothetical protein [Bacillus sp. FJAT-42376]AZB44124.1 hypothetical protein CEF21_18495 [Bacillus sp. FJAT-42376]